MAKVVPKKSGKELKEMGFKLSEKFNRTPQDEEESNFLISQAIESGELSGIELAECYIKSGEMYRDRSRDFEKALSLFSKATEIPGLPSWFAPHNYVEKLATYPEVYGLRKEKKNVELAGRMHQINLMLQDGKDLIMTARDLFNDLEKSKARGVGVEYVEIGFDYLKNALESCWEEVWMPVLYTTYGRGYKYHSEKTKENFDHAVSWFQKSIHTKLEDISPDQLALIVSDGSARACFELAELLSNPARFGFDESFKDEHQGEKVFHEGKEKLKKFGSLGVSSIIQRMFLNGWDEKLEYARTEADIPMIMELCRLGRECGQDSDAALYLFEGVVHHYIQRVRSAEDYQRVIGCYYNSLVAFQKLGNGHEWIAKCVAKHATFLALEGLSKKKDYDFEASQKLRTLLGEISQSPEDYNCNDIIKSIIDYYTNQYEDSKKPPRFMQRGAMVSTSIKKVLYEKVDLKLQDIQKDMQLYGYYDGFMFTLSQSYTTAQVITSGQVQIDDSPNSVVQLGLKIVSYVPFIGDKITDPLNQILAFMKGADMIQKANNVCTLASNQAAFDSLLQDALIEVMNLKKTEILTYEEITEEEQKWYQKVAGFLSKAKLSIERTIYGLRFKTAAQKLGSKHANELIAAWIANGKIYNDKPFLLPDDAKSELIKILTTSEFLAWEDEPEGGGKSQAKEKNEAVSKTLVDFTPTEKKSKCCEIF